VGEALRRVPERVEPARVAGGEREPAEAVVGAGGGDDPEAPGAGAGQTQGQVDGLGPRGREDGERERVVGAGGELSGEPCPPAADQVVVADVEVVEALLDGGDDARMAVPEVEDAAVAVAVPVPAAAVGVLKAGALPVADDDVDADPLERPDLAAVDVGGEGRARLAAARVGLVGFGPVLCGGIADR